MSFDGIVTRAIANELDKNLTSGRVNKIYQPHHTELVFQIRAQGKTHKLLISVNAQFARCHLTDQKYENPQDPPMFCMLLRKYLDGSFIESIKQVDFERIIHIDFKTRNELGDITSKRLVVELMGRHSNVILIDQETGKILDSIKHLTPSINRHRIVLPGQDYIEPPAQNKLNPLKIEEIDLLRVLDFNAGKLDKQLLDSISGFSPLLAKEVLHQAGLANKARIIKAFFEIVNQIKGNDFQPQIIRNQNEKDHFHVIHLSYLKGSVEAYPTASSMLENFYLHKAEHDLVKQKANDLRRFISNELNKNKTKLKKLKQTMTRAESAKEYQLFGELLTAHMHLLKKGEKEAHVVNYYDEAQNQITIPLNTEKTPSENAQYYFKKYTKAKHAQKIVSEQIQETNEEMVYFEGLLQQIETASLRDIEEIREELEEGGYLKKRLTKRTKKKALKPSIEHYYATDGTLILVGKNNKQNEYLTNRVANSEDIWLHTKDIPGSHVVIRSQSATEDTLLEAANIAAFFSKSRFSSTVPVDYTKIKHVKKPNGAKPGYVIYDHQSTLFVTPNEHIVIQLKMKSEAPNHTAQK